MPGLVIAHRGEQATGQPQPVIDRRFDLDAIADAHRHMEANANVGKILVDVG